LLQKRKLSGAVNRREQRGMDKKGRESPLTFH
jgi:hypothetical protein